jgi:hypothetical protein
LFISEKAKKKRKKQKRKIPIAGPFPGWPMRGASPGALSSLPLAGEDDKSFTPLNAAWGPRAAHPVVALGRPIFALCFRLCFFCFSFFRFFFLFYFFFTCYYSNLIIVQNLKKVQFF